jgi:hypothetical protein
MYPKTNYFLCPLIWDLSPDFSFLFGYVEGLSGGHEKKYCMYEKGFYPDDRKELFIARK